MCDRCEYDRTTGYYYPCEYCAEVQEFDAWMPWWREAEIESADRMTGWHVTEFDIVPGQHTD